MNRQLWLAFALIAPTVAGCVVRARPAVGVSTTVTSDDYGTAYATVPPPSPVVEYRPPPPGYGYLWVDGFWDWTGYDWSWNAGYWAPERAGFVYVRPQYVYDGGRWAYRRSYWYGPEGRRDYEWGRPGGAAGPVMRGAPPAYGAPQGGYAAPQQGYAPPPRTSYGSAPQPGYAAPPPRTGYGAAPQPGYAPPPSRTGYGAAPQPGYAPATQPGYAAPPPARTSYGAVPTQSGQPGQPGMSVPAARPFGSPPSGYTPAVPLSMPTRQGPAAPFGQTGRPVTAPQPNVNPTSAMGAGRGYAPPPQSNPAAAMGAGRGFAPPQSNPAAAMGARSATAPSRAVSGGARPAPAPVQNSGPLKRGRPPGQ